MYRRLVVICLIVVLAFPFTFAALPTGGSGGSSGGTTGGSTGGSSGGTTGGSTGGGIPGCLQQDKYDCGGDAYCNNLGIVSCAEVSSMDPGEVRYISWWSEYHPTESSCSVDRSNYQSRTNLDACASACQDITIQNDYGLNADVKCWGCQSNADCGGNEYCDNGECKSCALDYYDTCDDTDSTGCTRSVPSEYNACDMTSSGDSCGSDIACDGVDNNCDGVKSCCAGSGSSCSANSDCCSDKCDDPNGDGSGTCISSCPTNFNWIDSGGTGSCEPGFSACYASDGSVSPSCSGVPEYGNTCGGTTMNEACCYQTSYNGVDYGSVSGITAY